MCKYEQVTIDTFEDFRDNYSRFHPGSVRSMRMSVVERLVLQISTELRTIQMQKL